MSDRKINLEELIEDLDFNNELLFDVTHNGYGKTMYTRMAMKKAMLEFGKQLLELAAENAKANCSWSLKTNKFTESVDKQSILNIIKQVE